MMAYCSQKIVLEFTAYLKDRPLEEGLIVTCSSNFLDENSSPQGFKIQVEENTPDNSGEENILEKLEDLSVTDENELKQDRFVAAWYDYWASVGEKQVVEEWAGILEEYFTTCSSTSADTKFVEGSSEILERSELSTEELWIKHQQELYSREFSFFSDIWNSDMGKKATRIKQKRPKKKQPKYRGLQSVVNIGKKVKLFGFQYSGDNSDIESVSLSTYDESHIEDINASIVLSNKVNNVLGEHEITCDNGLCVICNSSGSSCCIISGQPGMKKYWEQRYRLFSKFDLGIQLDLESWFSVTAEKIAQHHAQRCACDVIIDAFCGAGGNAIQFAQTCNRVIAIDIDPIKISMARHNAAIYNVENKIEFIVGDFTHLCSMLKADVVFLSPPWGGPSYIQAVVYDVNRSLTFNNQNVYNLAKSISPNVAIYLPRNSDLSQILQLCGGGDSVEVEQNFLSRRLKSLTAYFGLLIQCDNK